MPGLPHTRRSADRDVPETQMDYYFVNRRTDSNLMQMFNFLDSESGCTFACAADKGPG